MVSSFTPACESLSSYQLCGVLGQFQGVIRWRINFLVFCGPAMWNKLCHAHATSGVKAVQLDRSSGCLDARHSGELCVSAVPDTMTELQLERADSLKDMGDENMASLDDITGWREELSVYHESDFYKEKSRIYIYEMPPKIPLSAIYEYVDLVLKNCEIKDAVIRIRKWYETQTDEIINYDNNPDYPNWDAKTIRDFASWFIMKRSLPSNHEAFRFAHHLAGDILMGDCSFVRNLPSPQLCTPSALRRIDLDK